ncbi:MAG: LysR family transcriptional regulator [Gammaproteobacteria bacterium]|nr:LysR family transcriptional regulator [Gammaproteobacteria bacterium]MBI5617050.1 LysR family transcriptional regulator [Gammaproteobacteria bacterium]
MPSLTIQSLLRRVDLFTLKLFLAAIEEGQIGRAAFREHLAASAATKRIQDLEDLIGLKLFDRSARGVVPSPAGRVVERHVRTMLATLEDLRRDLAELTEGVRGLVAIASPGIMITQFLAREIGDFTRRFPLVDVTLHNAQNAEVLRSLREGEVDFAVFSHVEGAPYDGIESIECHCDRLVAVVPAGHPLSQGPSVGLDALLDQELISLGEGTTIMSQLRHAALGIGREPRVRYTVTTIDAARSLVAAGLGIALQPGSVACSDERDHVQTLPVVGDWAKRSYRIGYLAGRPLSPAADAFIAQMTSPSAADFETSAGTPF